MARQILRTVFPKQLFRRSRKKKDEEQFEREIEMLNAEISELMFNAFTDEELLKDTMDPKFDPNYFIYQEHYAALLSKALPSQVEDKGKFIADFQVLRTNQERIIFCHHQETVKEYIEDEWADLKKAHWLKGGHKKDLEKSKQFHQEGLAQIQDGNLSQALESLSKAVIYLPFDSPQLAVLYEERSAVLFKLGKFQECINDLDQVLNIGTSDQLRDAIIARKKGCVSELDRRSSVVELKDSLGVSKELFDLLGWKTSFSGRNPIITNGSEALQLLANGTIAAKRDIGPDEDVIIEKPVAAILYPEYYDSHCHHCFQRLNGVSFPCCNCSRVAYCSDDCSLASWASYHQYECNYLHFLDTSKWHLAFRLILVTGIANVIAAHKSKSALTTKSVINGNDYNAVLAMESHDQRFPFINALENAITATNFLRILSKKLDLISEFNDDYDLLGGVLLTHIQQVRLRSIDILDQEIALEDGIVYYSGNGKPIGCAIYPTVASLRHNCQPNTLPVFFNSKLILKPKRKLQSGEEITYNILGGDLVWKLSRSKRQTLLSRRYFINCNCQLCADKRELFYKALSCPECRGPVIYEDDLINCQCHKCGAENHLDIKRVREQIAHIQKRFETGVELFNSGLTNVARRMMAESFSALRLLCYSNSEIRCKAAKIMAKLNRAIGEYQDAIRFCQESVEIALTIFGPHHVNTLLCMLTLVNYTWEWAEDGTDGQADGQIFTLDELMNETAIVHLRAKEILEYQLSPKYPVVDKLAYKMCEKEFKRFQENLSINANEK